MFPLIQLPRKSEALLFDVEPFGGNVSINSTSEEVRSSRANPCCSPYQAGFPLIQLPRKSEGSTRQRLRKAAAWKFPLIQLPRKSEESAQALDPRCLARVSINSTSEEVRRFQVLLHQPLGFGGFPLIQLPRKSEAGPFLPPKGQKFWFPLIQLPRKSEGYIYVTRVGGCV